MERLRIPDALQRKLTIITQITEKTHAYTYNFCNI